MATYTVDGRGRITAFGDNTSEVIQGGDKPDLLSGNGGNDTIYGGNDTDSLLGGVGDDSLAGGEDIDRLWGDAGNDTLDGGSNFDVLDGGAGDDYYYVDNTNDIVRERQANGKDTVETTVDYTNTSYVDVIKVTTPTGKTVKAQQWEETIVGGVGNDTIYANLGSDSVDGGAGNDLIVGGGDNDVLTGGEGADTFASDSNSPFFAKKVSPDVATSTITDFTPGVDKIQFTEGHFNFLPINFTFIEVATDVAVDKLEQHLIYHRPSGKLYLNLNGTKPGFSFGNARTTGKGGTVYILGNKPALTKEDIVVIPKK